MADHRIEAVAAVAEWLARYRQSGGAYRFLHGFTRLLLERGIEAEVPRADILLSIGEPPDRPVSELARPHQVQKAWITAEKMCRKDQDGIARPWPDLVSRVIGKHSYWSLEWPDTGTRTSPDEGPITYQSTQTRDHLSLIGRIFIHRDEWDLTSAKRSWTFFVPGGIGMLVSILLLFLFWIVAVQARQAPTLEGLAALLFLGLAGYAVYRYLLKPVARLGDERILLVPDLWCKVNAPRALLEIVRNGERRTVQLVKVTGTCSICSSDVYLAEGWRDFRRPVVGRCVESPSEHVFTFDRMGYEGEPLRRRSGFVEQQPE